MKKLLLAGVLLPLAGFGQITLDNTHFPVSGDQLIMSTSMNFGIDYLSTGANYTWDFSSLTASGQRFTNCRPMSEASTLSNLLFGPMAATAYRASYFSPTTDIPLDQITSVLPVTIDDISQFSKNTTAKLTAVGYEFVISGQGIPAKSDTIETQYEFPLNYGNSYASHGYTDLDMNPIYDAQWIQHRYRESDVDGWGTITTPYGTFDALRIHHRIQESDSIYISIGGMGTWVGIPVPEAHEYEWRAAEEKEAILRVRTSVILGSEQVTSVEYRDEYNGLGLKDLTSRVIVYPNPAADQLYVELSEGIDMLEILDQQGRVVATMEGNGAVRLTANVASLGSGLYYARVRTMNGTGIKLFAHQ